MPGGREGSPMNHGRIHSHTRRHFVIEQPADTKTEMWFDAGIEFVIPTLRVTVYRSGQVSFQMFQDRQKFGFVLGHHS